MKKYTLLIFSLITITASAQNPVKPVSQAGEMPRDTTTFKDPNEHQREHLVIRNAKGFVVAQGALLK